jgi:hypothetical protein
LEWWKLHEPRFPILSRMAKDYLSIMAISAPIESQFSIFGNIITKNRNSIQRATAIKIVCLKNWKLPEITIEESNSDSDSDSDSDSGKSNSSEIIISDDET